MAKQDHAHLQGPIGEPAQGVNGRPVLAPQKEIAQRDVGDAHRQGEGRVAERNGHHVGHQPEVVPQHGLQRLEAGVEHGGAVVGQDQGHRGHRGRRHGSETLPVDQLQDQADRGRAQPHVDHRFIHVGDRRAAGNHHPHHETDDHRRHARHVGREPRRVEDPPAGTYPQQHAETSDEHQRPTEAEGGPMVVGHFHVDRALRGICPQPRPQIPRQGEELVRGLVELGGLAGLVGRPQLAERRRTVPAANRRDRSRRRVSCRRANSGRSTVCRRSRQWAGSPIAARRDGPGRPASESAAPRRPFPRARVRFPA